MKPTNNYGLSDSLINSVKKAVEEAKLHPNQQKLDVHEPEKEELTSQDFKKLRSGKKVKDGIDTKPKLKEEEQIDEARSEPVDIAFETRRGKTENQQEVEHAARYEKSHGVKSKFADGPNGRTVVYSHSDPKKVKGALIKHHGGENVDHIKIKEAYKISREDISDVEQQLASMEEAEQIDEASHGYKLKLTKTTHPIEYEAFLKSGKPVKATEKHYEVHQNDKKVGNILHHYNDYGGHFYDADLHGKKVPYDRSKGGEGAHNFLKSVVNTKFHSNLKKEEVEQVGEGSEDKKDTAKLVAMMMGKKINKPEKPKDSNVTTHTGKQTYDAGSDDEPETPKRKSGPQGPMKRRFVPKSKLRMQFK